MSGAPSDSYGHGLFRTSSAGNISRRLKARARQAARRSAPIPRSRPKKEPRPSKRDQVAELLSEGLEFDAIAKRMGITPKAVSNHFYAIRAQLGPQAR